MNLLEQWQRLRRTIRWSHGKIDVRTTHLGTKVTTIDAVHGGKVVHQDITLRGGQA